ncbi:hypothetical protein THAOC_18237 [Thalassiosira oceanica]|uniref:Uncharacterized protein n=1 Tax=Thalassiosira oceanica TaxID=159749 RepID=K0SJY2_THAOC|nr:hypothetical protein THAOC_18237 [Thalassiosira oceanica]|eukprot:EJK61306.1 hypothetical protein THAOC_18237 [Thalassiosira oceanica]
MSPDRARRAALSGSVQSDQVARNGLQTVSGRRRLPAVGRSGRRQLPRDGGLDRRRFSTGVESMSPPSARSVVDGRPRKTISKWSVDSPRDDTKPTSS